MDNVIIEVRPRTAARVYAVPVIEVKAKVEASVRTQGAGSAVFLEGTGTPFLVADVPLGGHSAFTRFLRAPRSLPGRFAGLCGFLKRGSLPSACATGWHSPRFCSTRRARTGGNWGPFSGEVAWRLPGRYGEFLGACARNSLQAREMKQGRLTFQVGYGLSWPVGGGWTLHFGSGALSRI